MSNKPFAGYENEAFELLQRLAAISRWDGFVMFELYIAARHLLYLIRQAQEGQPPPAGGIKGLSRSTEGKKGKENDSDD
jgi:hypothetical protein